jgi:hypothetical protein
MKKVLETILLCACIGVLVGVIWSIYKDKPRSQPEKLEPTVYTYNKMTYIVFVTGAGEAQVRNYTLDSIELVTQNRFWKLDDEK